MKNAKSKTVSEYINQSPKELRSKLQQLRKIIKDNAPKATEKISYGMPYYSYKGRLLYFAWFKDHFSLFIMPSIRTKLEKELKPYHKSKATYHFPLDKPWPVNLIKKVVKTSVKTNEEKK